MTRSFLRPLALALAVSAAAPAGALLAPAAIAQAEAAVAYATSGEFERKSKRLSGQWQVIERDGQTVIRFADDFRAARGPDLKVFLSPTALSEVTGETATEGSILLGELQKTRGSQDYVLPEGVSLADFESVLVHCEAYSVLWGGGQL